MAKKIEFKVSMQLSDVYVEKYTIVITPDNPITRCVIYGSGELEHGREIAFGIGVRKHGDCYDLETGCRMALKSALRGVPAKTIRQAIWEQYMLVFPVNQRPTPDAQLSQLIKKLRRFGYLMSLARQ